MKDKETDKRWLFYFKNRLKDEETDKGGYYILKIDWKINKQIKGVIIF